MVITYHNDTCFRVASGKVSLIVDPPNDKFKSDLTLFTRSEILASKDNKNGNIVIYGGGEYEVQEIMVQGIQANYDVKIGAACTMYSVLLENITMLFMGGITEMPPIELLEKIGDVDILFIPVGRGYLDPKNAAKLVKQIQPRITVPYPAKQAAAFLEEVGKKGEIADKLVLKKKDIIEMGEKTKIVCIKS